MNYTSSSLCVLLISLVWCIICCAKQESADIQDDLQCPPWFFYNTTTETCKCFSSPSTDQIVKCTKKEALLNLGYCMTYEEENGFYVGLCDSVNINSLNTTKDNYIRLPSNVSDLNDYMCGSRNRKDQMCSHCIDGFGLAVFSIGYTCTNCTGAWYGIPLYLVLEFVPITIFYFIIMCFFIDVTSAPMVAFVFYSQMAVTSFSSIVSNHLIINTVMYRFLSILVSFYGIWNLDFFRFVIPPFCVSSLLMPIHINFLYFISAFYPLCLTVITWLCIHLYSQNFKPVVWLWNKLKQSIFRRLDVNWDGTNTVVNVFAAFFLLSYAKLVFASLQILQYSISLNISNRSLIQTLHVLSDPSMEFFGKEHLPFAIFSVLIILFAVLPIPLLLALYPIRSFRTLYFKCPISNRIIAAINIFIQKFYNCYRDGTEGGRDMRSLVCLYFFLRVLRDLGTVHQIPANIGYSILVFIYIACSMLIALAQPYKRTYMNNIDALILANLAILSFILGQLSGELSDTSNTFFYISGSILSSLPLLGFTGIVIYKIIRKIVKVIRYKRSLISLHQEGHIDTELHDGPKFQECTKGVEDYGEEHASQRWHSFWYSV